MCVKINYHHFNVSAKQLNLKIRSLQWLVIFIHSIANGRLVFESDVGEIVRTNLKECYLPAFFKMIIKVLFGDFSSNVAHDDRVVGLEHLRLIAAQHKKSFAPVVLLIP